jgi:hypothetical protein
MLLVNMSQKRGCGVNDGTVVATCPHESFRFSTFLPNYVTLAFIHQVSVDGASGRAWYVSFEAVEHSNVKQATFRVVKHKEAINRGCLD